MNIIKKLEKEKETKKTAKKSKNQAASPTDETPASEEEGIVEPPTVGGMKISIQRYKGLGEMNPEQLWETTMNPEKRIMKKITAKDAELANKTFEILMGSEVEPRKKFIQTYAKDVKNLDI